MKGSKEIFRDNVTKSGTKKMHILIYFFGVVWAFFQVVAFYPVGNWLGV